MRSTKTKKSSRPVLIVALVVVLATVAGLFLFRRSTHDNPALGVVTTEYRWGRPRTILVDANRDGTPDARALVRLTNGRISPHSPPAELWESTRCDGVTDLHAVFDPAGRIALLEFDADRDGRYERTLDAEAASAFWRGLQRPPGCGAKIED